MNCFELISGVLDELWREIPGRNDSEKAELIKPKLDELSESYRSICDGTAIDYSDPLTQFAYIFTYTSAHGDFLYQLLLNASRKHSFQTSGDFKLTSLGGGPGSDLIGCLKFFERHEASDLTFTFNSFDKDSDWSVCWANVAGCISREGSTDQLCKMLISNFHRLDVTHNSAAIKIRKFMDADMFSMLFFMSEIINKKNESESFFDFFFKNVKSGAIVAFIDNRMSEVYNWFDELAGNNDFDVLITYENEIRASSHEEKTVLQKYMTLTGRSPKVKGSPAFRVIRKK